VGYDVTFHPVRLEKEGQVLRDLLLGCRSPKDIVKLLPNCTDDLPEVVEDQLNVLLEDHESNEYLACHASYRLAMLAGYIRPYWYARGQAISFFLENDAENQRVFKPFLQWLGEPWRQRADPSCGLILENYTGSGVIEQPKEFLEWFNNQQMGTLFDEEGIDAVRRCASYAISHGCQIIEAADVFSPIGGYCTNPNNVRAHFLGNLDNP
jgi:hypothetical protein